MRGFTSDHYSKAFWFDSPIPVAYVGKDGTFLDVNPAFSSLTGYTAAELRTRTYQSITHNDDIQPDTHLAEETILGKIPGYSMIKRYHRKDGYVVWITLHVRAIFDDEAFVCFVSYAVPLPNSGRFKVGSSKGTETSVEIRPVIKAHEFLIDNWKWVASMVGPALYILWRSIEWVVKVSGQTGITP